MPVDGRTLRAERRRNETRERLLSAIASLLEDDRAYADVSVEDIAAQAGLSRSMFYAYFDDKGALVRAWLQSVARQLEVAAQAWWSLDGDSTPDDLRATISAMVDTYRPYAPLIAATHQAGAHDEAVRQALDGMLAGSIRGLREHIARGKRAGWIGSDVLAGETAAWLTCLAESGQHRIEQEVGDEELALLIDAAVDVIWRALYA